MTGAAGSASERRLGIALVALSAAVFGLAGVLTKSIDADPLTITSWRGLVGGILISAYVFWRRAHGSGESLRLGRGGWMLALLGTAASIAFIAAFKNTYVANVVVIYATVPFVVAVLAWSARSSVARQCWPPRLASQASPSWSGRVSAAGICLATCWRC